MNGDTPLVTSNDPAWITSANRCNTNSGAGGGGNNNDDDDDDGRDPGYMESEDWAEQELRELRSHIE